MTGHDNRQPPRPPRATQAERPAARMTQAESAPRTTRAEPRPSDTVEGRSQTTKIGQGRLPASGEGLAPGAVFGRYHIERMLGEGAMGTVYLARDTALGRLVALKIPKLGTGDAEGQQRFLREARTAAALSNPNICPIHDVGEVNGTPYLTMAYIDGRPLADYCNAAQPVPPRNAAVLVRKLALALAEAHTAGVIHRDLKPENVMVDRKGEPVVMDFGLARAYQQAGGGRVTQSGVICGSPAYMSPEQIRDDQDAIGPPSDIYSLGVVLYELVTGKLPFEGSVGTILAKVLTEQPLRLQAVRGGIDAHIDAICMRMMAKAPGERFGSMQEVAAALTSYLSLPHPEAVAAVPSRGTSPRATVRQAIAPLPGTITTSRKRQQQQILMISSGSVVGLVLIGAIAFWLFGGSPRPQDKAATKPNDTAEQISVAREEPEDKEEAAEEPSKQKSRSFARVDPLKSNSDSPAEEMEEKPAPQETAVVTPPSRPTPPVEPSPTPTPEPEKTDAKMPQIYVDLPKLPRPGETIEKEQIALDPPAKVAKRLAAGNKGRWSLIVPEDFLRKIVVVDQPGQSSDREHPDRIQVKLIQSFDAEIQANSPPAGIIAECLLGDSGLVWTWALTKDLDVRGIQSALRQCVLSRADDSSPDPVLIALQKPAEVSGPVSLSNILSKPDNKLTLFRNDRTSLFAPLAAGENLGLGQNGSGGSVQATFDVKGGLRIDCPSLAQKSGLKRFAFVISASIDQMYARVETDPSVTDAAELLAAAKRSRLSLGTRFNKAQASYNNGLGAYAAAEQMSANTNAERQLKNAKLSNASQQIRQWQGELAKVSSLIPAADNLINQRQSEHEDLQRKSQPINDTPLTGSIYRTVGDVRVVAVKLGTP